jgi:hypothetical protein
LVKVLCNCHERTKTVSSSVSVDFRRTLFANPYGHLTPSVHISTIIFEMARYGCQFDAMVITLREAWLVENLQHKFGDLAANHRGNSPFQPRQRSR